MGRLRYCEKARKEAKGYDRVSINLVTLLKLPVRRGETAAIVSRVRRLFRLFLSTSTQEAKQLQKVLDDPDAPIGRFFKCELSTALRNELRSVLASQTLSSSSYPNKNPKGRSQRNAVYIVTGQDGVNPLSHPKYIDNIAKEISIRVVLVEWVLLWRQSGKQLKVGVPRKKFVKAATDTLIWGSKIFANEAEAIQEAKNIEKVNAESDKNFSPQVITFFRGDGNTIQPNLYSPISAPRFFSGVRMYVEEGHLKETVGLFTDYYGVIRDFVNPYFLNVDEQGELSFGGPPKLKLPRLKIRGMSRILKWKNKPSLETFLRNIKKKLIWVSGNGKHRVYQTEHGQIIGSFDGLQSFRLSKQAGGKYKGWHRHHIIESRHIKALGLKDLFPSHGELPCVLLPSKAHSQRVSGMLTRLLNTKAKLTDTEVFVAYAKAYSGVGGYTGATASAIQLELKRIVGAMLELD